MLNDGFIFILGDSISVHYTPYLKGDAYPQTGSKTQG